MSSAPRDDASMPPSTSMPRGVASTRGGRRGSRTRGSSCSPSAAWRHASCCPPTPPPTWPSTPMTRRCGFLPKLWPPARLEEHQEAQGIRNCLSQSESRRHLKQAQEAKPSHASDS